MRILYTGPLGPGSLTESRRRALVEIGHEVEAIDQLPFLGRGLKRKVQTHLVVGAGVRAYNRDMVGAAERSRPELVYVDQASYLSAATLRRLRATGAKLVHYTSEMFDVHPWQYWRLARAVHLFDAHVVTHPPAFPWLRARGAQKIVLTTFGYDPSFHVPVELTPEEQARFGCDVQFIGHWEPTTERSIRALRDAGVPVRVHGPGWHRARSLEDRRTIAPLYGPEYVKAIAGAKISLCFLSKWGSNSFSSSRSFEIPAIGSMLLAERTEDHQRFYIEGEEAAFFANDEELVAQARRYLADAKERERVAWGGHKRCTTSGYTHKDRMVQILREVA